MTFHEDKAPDLGEKTAEPIREDHSIAAMTDVLSGETSEKSVDFVSMYRFNTEASDPNEAFAWPREFPIFNPSLLEERLPETGGFGGGASMASQTGKLIEAMAGFVAPPGVALPLQADPVRFVPDLAAGWG